MNARKLCFLTVVCWSCLPWTLAAQETPELSQRVLAAMQQATRYYHEKVAVHGGYVYHYSLDLRDRRGEGKASPTEIWVQPPGTPTVGMACLRAWEATGDKLFLDAAVDAARALVYGQLESGAWTASIDFEPNGAKADRYRHGKGRAKGKNYSTLDDDKSQAAMRLMMQVDQALEFKDAEIHDSAMVALESLLKAQFPNGGFPQGWRAPVSPHPIVRASYPSYDWRTENRVKDYWDLYTLNDGLAGTVAETLEQAYQIYGDQRFRDSLLKLGDFLILAQMPEPQPAWAQQYTFEMHPAWARKFEPPAVVGHESEDAMATLFFIFEKSGDEKYLQPVPAALAWLKRSLLPDGRMARFYELRTNRPLYMTRDTYELTWDDGNLPTHYGFQGKSRVEALEQQYLQLKQSGPVPKKGSSLNALARDAERIISELDAEGRWIADKNDRPLGAQPTAGPADQMLSSRLFSRQLERLSEYLNAAKAAK